MATFVLIPGAGSTSWYWHLVVPLLEEAGHRCIAPDLPCDDDTATFDDYRDAVLAAIGDNPPDDLVLVAQSIGGFTAPLVADRIPVRLIVMLAAMVPERGEPAGDWWTNTGAGEASAAMAAAEGRDPDDMDDMFLHDVPPDVIAEGEAHLRDQSDAPFSAPFPIDWPDVPTRFLLCRDDRFFPADLFRRVVPERLGIVPDEMSGGHCPALAHPEELAERLLAYVTD